MSSTSHPIGILLPLAFASPLLAQTNIWTAPGTLPGDRFGLCISAAGDLDGDGVPDLLVGAPDDDLGGNGAGAMIALSGANGSVLWRVNGGASGDSLGFQVAGVGDLDGDGVGDAVGGARYSDVAGPNYGAAIVVSGATGNVLYSVFGTRTNGRFGEAIGAAGDVNNDGRADFVVGARLDDTLVANTGAARVYSGLDGSLLYELFGENGSDFFGRAVGAAGDVNADGFDDFIVGAPGDDDAGSSSGSVRVYSGATGLVLWRVDGDMPGDSLGGKVAPAGDVNGDGTPDVIAGLTGSDLASLGGGAAKVYSGVDGTVLFTFTGATPDGELGAAVSGGHDVNGDGWVDLLVGARLDLVAGEARGKAFVYSGFDGGLLYEFEGPEDLSQFGDTNVLLSDTNGDGFAEVAVGAFGAFGTGVVQLFSGRDTIGSSFCGPAIVNTTGVPARIFAEGSLIATQNDVRLTAASLPAGSNGIFITSPDQFTVVMPGGNAGTLCIASAQIGRYAGNILTAGPTGTVSLTLDLGSVPLPVGTGTVVAGETRYWQYWYRDFPSSNFTDGLAITFE
jgi:hypothetical protein